MIVHQSVERTTVTPRRVLLGAFLLTGALLMAVPVASASSLDTARVKAIVGAASVEGGGAIAEASHLRAGDVLAVRDEGRVTITFDDGGSLALRGPARLALLELDTDGNRVRLEDGAISRALAGGVALEVQTPVGASLVLQNASGAANVVGDAVSFQKLGGHYARLWQNGRAQELRGAWSNGGRVLSGATAPKMLASPMAAPMAAESARVCAMSGGASSTRGGRSSGVSKNSTFAVGDSISVNAGGKLTVCFADNSSVALVGPASMSLVQIDSTGRRVRLESGVIAEAYTRGVALEIQTPSDTSLVLQNATGFARVNPGDKVSFQKLDGDFAQVYANDKASPLAGAWSYNLRSGSATTGAAPRAASTKTAPRAAKSARSVAVPKDAAVFEINGITILYRPAADFTKEPSGDNGTKLTYTGDDIGHVVYGGDSVFYFENGDFIVFDGQGDVTAFTGFMHVYKHITAFDFWDNPVENAGDASIVHPTRR